MSNDDGAGQLTQTPKYKPFDYLEAEPAPDAPVSDNPSGLYCPACRKAGMSNCSYPEECGGMRRMKPNTKDSEIDSTESPFSAAKIAKEFFGYKGLPKLEPKVEGENLTPTRGSYLSPHEWYRLHEAVEPNLNIKDSFGSYLVGSVLKTPSFRDVDVRTIIPDIDFLKIFGYPLDQHYNHATQLWLVTMLSSSRRISEKSGLRVDYQVQSQTYANTFKGPRNALILADPLPFKIYEGE